MPTEISRSSLREMVDRNPGAFRSSGTPSCPECGLPMFGSETDDGPWCVREHNHNPNARYFFDEWPDIGHPRFTKRCKEVRFWIAVGPRNGSIVGFRPSDPGIAIG